MNILSSIKPIQILLIAALLASFGLATAAAAPSQIASGAAGSTHWTYQTIESYNQTGQYASLAFDTKHDQVDISYYSPSLQALKLAWSPYPNGNCGLANSWRCFTVDHNEDDGKYSSLAYNTAGDYWGIAYHDSTNGALKYSNDECLNNCNFRATTVDQTVGAIVGRGTSLKFDAKGIPHIAYYQAFPAALKYAQYVGGGAGNCTDYDWQCDTIESGTAIGQYLSLDLDAIGRVHIAYYDGGTGMLKYASQVGSGGTGCSGGTVATTWMCQVVDAPSGVDVGAFVSLHQSKCFLPGCVDPTQIAYYDATNHTLKYARYGSNGSCSVGAMPGWQCDTIETVGSWTSPALYLSMAVRSDGTAVIAYNDRDDSAANGRLKLASPTLAVGNCGPNGGLFQTWQCDTLDTGNSPGGYLDVGKYPSIAINSAGLISVAYYDATNADLEVAIEKATQTITFNPNPLPNKLTTDPPFTLNASASSGLPVTFAASGKCSVNGNTVTLSGQAGSCTITAQQAGNTSYDAAPDVVRSFMVNYPTKQDQTISFAALQDKTLGDPPFSISASASSGLPVTFAASGKCSVNGNTVTLSGQAGNCTVTALQAGNATYNPAPDVARSFTINTPAKQSQAITFAALPNKTVGAPPFSIGATASSGLLVTFTASGKCNVSGKMVTLNGAGSCTITAQQPGNATYNAAAEVARTFQIGASGPANSMVYLPLLVR